MSKKPHVRVYINYDNTAFIPPNELLMMRTLLSDSEISQIAADAIETYSKGPRFLETEKVNLHLAEGHKEPHDNVYFVNFRK